MHARFSAERRPDDSGSAERPVLRACVFSSHEVTPEAITAILAHLPAHARVTLFGTCAALAPLDGSERGGSADRFATVLHEATRLHPGEDLVLVDARARLAPLSCERLLRVLERDDVLGVLALDPVSLPLEHADSVETARIDALCFASSARRFADEAMDDDAAPLLSAWHGGRLAHAGATAATSRDTLDATGLRVVRLDHAYAGGPRTDHGRPAFASLHARVADAIDRNARASLPGVDDRPVLLHVLHGWGGGAERWVRDFAAADDRAHPLVLVARGSFTRRRHGEWLELHDGALGGVPLARWPMPRPIADTALADAAWRAVFDDVRTTCCVDAVLVSSLIGHSLDALRSGLPTFCVVHDHYPLWPILHRDFGDPALAFDDAQRTADLAAAGAGREFASRDPAHWKRLRDGFVEAALGARATLVAPSASALANQIRLAPELAALPARVIGHGLAPWPAAAPRVPAPPARARLRLVMLGRVRAGKGARLLAAALPRLREHAELFLLGAGADAHAFFGESGVHVLLDYRHEELPALLARLQPDAALLLPTVAETFSYTLSELRSLGVPVIATRIGALAERIEDGTDGFLVAPDADAIVARVASLARDRAPLARVRSHECAHATAREMAAAWQELLALGKRRTLRYPLRDTGPADLEGDAAAAALAETRAREERLRAELADATREAARRGDWGHALDRELAGARREIGRVHGELEERSRWALALNEELQDIKPRYERILASASWRITAPLRRAKALARRVRASLAFRSARLRSTAGRVRGSLAQRGFAGTLARIAQELRPPQPVATTRQWPEPDGDTTPFAVPASPQPLVSIVMPVYGKWMYTLACLRSIAAHAGPLPFEVIVVDDASPDETAERLAAVDGIRVLRNDTNLGFIGSCNAGATAACGEFVLFLNNDTLVTPGWLETLHRCLVEAPDAGLVGARLVYPDGRLQEAGGIVFDDASGWNYGRFEATDDPRFLFRRQADYCSGAAILLRKALFERLGGFDTRYAPAYYEDTDLAFAVRAAGLRVYVEPAATVVHFEGITSGTDTASGTKRYQVVNRGKFLEKWRDALARQPRPGTPIHIAATHRARKRVLVVDATTPMPDHDSGSLRMTNLLRVLVELGCQPSFLPQNRQYVERYTAALQSLGVEALYAPHAQDPVEFMRRRGGEFDLVILSRHYVAAEYIGLVRLHAPRARIAFDTVDLHYLREQRAAELADDAALLRHARNTRAQELRLIRESDVTLVVSEVERALLAREAPGARVEVLSNVHEVYGCRKPFGERRDLVFVGGFQHPPNVDAVEWFVREVFPDVRAALPDVRFHVIGSRVPDSIRALAGEHVIVHGFVDDILPFMDGCRISVAPLRYGAGVKGKVNMAMSCGLPVVATTPAVEGMHVRSGEDVLVADDAAVFADAIVRLHGDERLWNLLSRNGLANVETHFSFAAARAAIERLLAD